MILISIALGVLIQDVIFLNHKVKKLQTCVRVHMIEDNGLRINWSRWIPSKVRKITHDLERRMKHNPQGHQDTEAIFCLHLLSYFPV